MGQREIVNTESTEGKRKCILIQETKEPDRESPSLFERIEWGKKGEDAVHSISCEKGKEKRKRVHVVMERMRRIGKRVKGPSRDH